MSSSTIEPADLSGDCAAQDPRSQESGSTDNHRSTHLARSSQPAERVGIDGQASDQGSGPDQHPDQGGTPSNQPSNHPLPDAPRPKQQAAVARQQRRSTSGRGSIYLRTTDGRWVATIDLPREPGGPRRRKTFYGRTQKEVRTKLEKFRALHVAGAHQADDRITLATHCEKWMNSTALLTAKASTVSGYKDLLHRHALPVIGHRRLVDLRPSDIDKVVAHVLAKGLSVSTARQVRRVLSSALSAADRDGLIPYNPVAKTRPPKLNVLAKTSKQDPYTQDEVRALLASLDGHPYEVLFTLMTFTGMRRGEALGLKWEDLQLNEHGWCLRINRQIKEIRITSPDGSSIVQQEECAPKTAAGIRNIPISEDLYDLIVAKAASDNLGERVQLSGWIFQTSTGTPLWPSNVTQQWSTHLKRAGLRHIRLHDLRHTFATITLNAGEQLSAITETLGHSSISITKDIYASRATGLAPRAVTAFAQAIKQSSDTPQIAIAPLADQ